MWKDFWDWLASLPQGSASFVGTLTGSTLGLFALLVGALFNAHLNRKRDDKLRKKEARALAVALRAELAGKSRNLLDNAKRLEEQKGEGHFLVPDIAQSLRIMPSLTDKLGLLDEETIVAVLDAYVVMEQYCERLIISGGKLMDGLPGNRRLVSVDPTLFKRLRGGNLGVNDVIEKAIKRLDSYLR
jgi:hypothetical protein